MTNADTSFLFWVLGALQLAGIASAWLARLSEGSRNQASCQALFLTLLAVIGLSTMVSVTLGSHYWLPCGGTLSIMALAAIWDFRAYAREIEPFEQF